MLGVPESLTGGHLRSTMSESRKARKMDPRDATVERSVEPEHYQETLFLRPDERTVVLSGAGFSRGLGIPLQDELLETVVPEPMLRIHNFLRRRQFRHPIRIEDFLTSLDFEEGLSHRKSQWSSAALSSHIALSILEGFSSAKVDDDARERFLANFGILLDCTAAWVTLNWDTLVETVCKADGREFSYFGESPGLPLLKLHGSIDWFKKNSKTESYMQSREFVRLFGNYYRYELFTNLNNRELIPDEIAQLMEISHPVLIPPTHFKSFSDRFIRKIWRAVWREMSRMDHLVIVGYSFPESDLAIRHLLDPMICRLLIEKPPRVTIINPDPGGKVAARFAPYCVGSVQFIRAKFEDVQVIDTTDLAV